MVLSGSGHNSEAIKVDIAHSYVTSKCNDIVTSLHHDAFQLTIQSLYITIICLANFEFGNKTLSEISILIAK